jgi:hypothetical protein
MKTIKLKLNKAVEITALRYAWNNLKFKQLWDGATENGHLPVYCEVSGPDKEINSFINTVTVFETQSLGEN